MHRTFIFTIFLYFSLVLSVHAYGDVGFVDGIWYASNPVFATVPTRVYVAFRNNTEHDLTGIVHFSVDGKRIGSSNISALSGRLVEAWVDWTPTQGAHAVVATVSDTTLHKIGGGTEKVAIAGIIASSSLSIDIDTDGDGVGNASDTDDDGDGVSDDDEIARGSNPLVATEEPVTVKDNNEEVKKLPESDKSPLLSSPSQTQEGLEQYVDNSIADSLLSNATKEIEATKEKLDTYRDQRRISLENPLKIAPVPNDASSSNTATITRTKIDAKNHFLESFIQGIASLLSAIWTLILFLTSKALSFPALLELIFLIGILYIFYRIARRLGRRQKY